MCAKILEIDDRTRPRNFMPPRLSYFAYHEGEHIPLATVVENPNMSLYCLDDANRRAIFVATSTDVDLAKAPFYYKAQYDYAQYLVALSYEELFQLAGDFTVLENLIFIYTVGRSGSTLLSRVFNELEGIESFSEPDVLTNCAFIRQPDGSRDQELIKLIRSCIYMLCKSHNTSTYAIKWRDWIIQIGDLIHAAFPDTRNIFLYRDAEKWANSWYRIYTMGGIDFDESADLSWLGNQDEVTRIIPLFPKFTEGFGKARTVDALVTEWLSTMDGYLRLHRQGIPFLAIRYEDLDTHRQQVVQAIFDYCDLPPAQVETGLKAFEHDAQQGTLLEGTSHQQPSDTELLMNAEQSTRLRTILQKHDTIKTPDFTVPGSLEIK